MSATLTNQPAPESGLGVRKFVLECPHGSTAAKFVAGGSVANRETIANVLVQRHGDAYGCSCARQLDRDAIRTDVGPRE